MLNALHSLFTLRWQQTPHTRPLPSHITRTYIPTPNGYLELLICTPTTPDPTIPPIFFIHGGYGSAGVWLEWMTHLHNAGYKGNIYAYSARNHGGSYSVPYLRMVYRTGFDEIVEDFLACFSAAKARQREGGGSEEFVLVGHSSGGGVVQYALSRGRGRCRALCLVDAIPHFGALPVYANWLRHDPWFPLRSLFHLQHPTSPLSSLRLVHRAFFGNKFPTYKTKDFMRWMPAYEAMGWPMAMMGDFLAWWRGRSRWLDVRDIVKALPGSGEGLAKDRICIMLGDQDVLMDLAMCRRQAAEYREALKGILAPGKAGSESPENEETKTKHLDGGVVERSDGVQLVVIEGAGHHVQNDVQTDIAAAGFLQFVEQC